MKFRKNRNIVNSENREACAFMNVWKFGSQKRWKHVIWKTWKQTDRWEIYKLQKCGNRVQMILENIGTIAICKILNLQQFGKLETFNSLKEHLENTKNNYRTHRHHWTFKNGKFEHMAALEIWKIGKYANQQNAGETFKTLKFGTCGKM